MKKKDLIKKFIDITSNWITILDLNNYKTGRINNEPVQNYVKKISNVLFYNYSWESFDTTTKYRKKFNKWNSMGIFNFVYLDLYKKYIKRRWFKNLFIDSSIVQNFNCSDKNIDFYYKIKSKKQTKLNIISDNNNVVHSYIITNPKKHDVSVVKQLVSGIKCNLNKNTYIAGDKGYITKKYKYVKQINKVIKTVLLISPKRNNQTKKRLNKCKREILKKRFKVEQVFSHLKRTYLRLSKLHDKKMETYETYLMMAMSCQIIKQL